MKRKMTNYEMARGRPDVTNPLLILTLLAVLTCPVAVRAQSAGIRQEVTHAAAELTWLREFENNGAKVDIYQPQIEKWAGTDVETKSAVAITSVDSNAPGHGGAHWSPAPSQIDKPTPARETVGAHAALQREQKLTTQIELRAQETLYMERPAVNEKSLGRFKLDSNLVQLFKTDHPLQLINPAAPERYGSAEDSVVRDLSPSKASGLK